jgi:5-formyltetrahydrofolate cyclo-ligase
MDYHKYRPAIVAGAPSVDSVRGGRLPMYTAYMYATTADQAGATARPRVSPADRASRAGTLSLRKGINGRQGSWMAAITRSAAVNEAKQLLRVAVRSRVRALSAAELASQSESVLEQLLTHEWFASSRCVCCYIPMAGKELDTYRLLHAILGSGRQCLVPRVFGNGAAEMAMLPLASVEELESLPKNKWGIPEHPAETLRAQRGGDVDHATGVVSALEAQIDLLVVPAVAYDRAGHRLGQGRGYYDSFLQRLRAAQEGSERRVKTVGLGLSCQVLSAGQVPVDELDETLDLVIGPTVTPSTSSR